MRKVPVSTLALLAALAILSFVVSVPVHAQTYSVLYNFGINSGDPTMFEGIIAQGRDGNLYTTATHGGANGDGAVFKITPAGKLTVLYSFCSQASCADGDTPVSGLTLGREGDFYGATALGGTLGYGNIFKITPAGGFTVLYNFTGGSDGSHSDAAPIQGTDGNFYGTSSGLGGATCGSIYKISPAGVLTPLFAFDSTHGCNPFDALALAGC
jgi:uncharacterized repeat protein (TIGR03803 family)